MENDELFKINFSKSHPKPHKFGVSQIAITVPFDRLKGVKEYSDVELTH